MKNKTSIIDKRDMELAVVQEKIENLTVNDLDFRKLELMRSYDKLVEMIFLADGSTDFQTYKTSRTNKRILVGLVIFMIGVIFTFIPTFFVLTMGDVWDGKLKYKFVPNAIVVPKQVLVQKITSKSQAIKLRHSAIRDSRYAKEGSYLKVGKSGPRIIGLEEIKHPSYQFTPTVPKTGNKILFDNYKFLPDTILYRDQMQIQVIDNLHQLRSALNSFKISEESKMMLEIGSAIFCSTYDCFVISRIELEDEFGAVKRIG